MADSVRPQRRQPTRLPRPWDSPGKNTGVGCHFLLQCGMTSKFYSIFSTIYHHQQSPVSLFALSPILGMHGQLCTPSVLFRILLFLLILKHKLSPFISTIILVNFLYSYIIKPNCNVSESHEILGNCIYLHSDTQYI